MLHTKLHLFTPIDAVTGLRLAMQLTDADIAKTSRGRRWSATVTNQEDGLRYYVRSKACSLRGCYCDAVAVRMLPKHRGGDAA